MRNIEDFEDDELIEDLKIAEYPVENRFIIEMAGKDSIAAAIKIIEQNPDGYYLPISFIHRAMTKSADVNQENLDFLNEYYSNLPKDKRKPIFGPLLQYNISKEFERVILDTKTEVEKKYSYYSPCAACHLLLHLLRIPIAKHFKIKKVISGERIFHDYMIKINQTEDVLSYFKEIMRNYGIELMQPLEDLVDTIDIRTILGKNWDLDAKQMSCVYSRNYQNSNGSLKYPDANWTTQMEDFYYPIISKLLKNYNL